MSLNLFAFFHINLNYSAIEENKRSEVIKKCYWPLLNIIKKHELNFGLEISGHTLEQIQTLDPKWIEFFKSLLHNKKCELIGSGYSQIIGPLVPYKLTLKNLEIGNNIYSEILQVRPNIALINEQAFSTGMISLYKQMGYETIITEWDNASSINADWDKEVGYLPHVIEDNEGNYINLIWNHSIAFQKFQRYVHGDIDKKDLIEYIKLNLNDKKRVFPLYGNDIEIFDFRPGRYMTEAQIIQSGEWKRIDDLLIELRSSQDINFIKVSDVVKLHKPKLSNLKLTSAAQPISVKKQSKYNILRWAVTGRDDLKINTDCWKIFSKMNQKNIDNIFKWKKLCYFWSSDFRTHITDNRWRKFLEELESFKINLGIDENEDKKEIKRSKSLIEPDTIYKDGKFITFKGKRICCKFNTNRGFAIEEYIDLNHNDKKVFGTLEHGYFDDIRFGADFYSGHTVFEAPGKHKITDLEKVDPEIYQIDNKIFLSCSISTIFGKIKKDWIICDDDGSINLRLSINSKDKNIGSLRLMHLTLNSDFFDEKKIFLTHNGGEKSEIFEVMKNIDFNHDKPISQLISANQGVGITQGKIEIGDYKKRIRLKFNKSDLSLVGLISSNYIKNKSLIRLMLSAREVDDTSKKSAINFDNLNIELKLVDNEIL